jgi:hypothetical protein
MREWKLLRIAIGAPLAFALAWVLLIPGIPWPIRVLLKTCVLLYLIAYPAYLISRRWRQAQSGHKSSVIRDFAWRVCLFSIALVFFIAAFQNVGARAIVSKAEADVRALASAVEVYKAYTGVLPNTLADLTSPATNAAGLRAGPFIGAIPAPPRSRAPAYLEILPLPPPQSFGYHYERRPDGTFSITATVYPAGGARTVKAP